MKNSKDLAAGLVCTAAAVFYLSSALSIQVFQGAGAAPVDSRMVPMIWGGCFLLLGLALTLRGWRAVRSQGAEKTGDARGWLERNAAVCGTFVLLALYAFSMKTAGFILSTGVYLLLQMLLLTPGEKRNLPALLLLSAGCAVGVDLLFVKALHVPLPAGWLGW